MLTWFLGPVFYWLDLRGEDGRPSLTKVIYLAGCVVSLYGLIVFGKAELQRGTTGADPDLSSGFLIYVVAVLLFCLGRDVFIRAFGQVESYIVSRFPAGGTTQTTTATTGPSVTTTTAPAAATTETKQDAP